MRLIDADELLEDGIRVSYGYDHDGLLLVPLADVTRSVKDAPTVELSRWIPVSERLPMGAKDGETSENVVAYFVDDDIGAQVCTGWLNFDTWYLVVGCDDYHTAHRLESVTHWMPLPAPPTPGECSAVGEEV